MLEKGGLLTLAEDIQIAEQQVITMADNTVLDMNGKTISDKNMDLIIQGKNGTVKNGIFSVLEGGAYALFVGDEGETDNIVIENVIMYGGVNVYNASKVTLRNCEIHGTTYRAVWADFNAEIIIESGTYYKGAVNTLQASKYVRCYFQSADGDVCSYRKIANDGFDPETTVLTISGGTHKAGSRVRIERGTVYIIGGLFDGRDIVQSKLTIDIPGRNSYNLVHIGNYNRK